MSVKIGIFGSGGLIGKELVKFLAKDYSVHAKSSSLLYETPEILSDNLKGLDIVINLAGAPISGRWNRKKKNLIYNSRICTVSNLVKAINLLTIKPVHFINASAVGIYPDHIVCDESSLEHANNFLYTVVSNWEKEAQMIKELNVSLTIIRIGVVLSREGGMYKTLRKLFISGLGGRIGNGKQGFSFVLLEDLVRIFEFVIKRKVYGIVNGVCPEPLTNGDFTYQTGKILKRPAILSIPAVALKLLFNDGSCLLLDGQKVIPSRLLKEGFVFRGNNLNTCLKILEK